MSAAGNLFIIAAPSGAGKTSLVRALLEAEPDLRLSISHTTRAPRLREEQGVHYHFCSRAEFEQMILKQAFLEYADVFGNCYGTSKAGVIDALRAGNDVLLEIDYQGAQQVRASMPHTVSIFIAPPSLEVLLSRLVKRNEDSAEVINRRTRAAKQEIQHFAEFDFLIVNDAFEVALHDLIAIVRAQRLRTSAQSIRHAELMAALLA